jgi:hypothetical protein
MAWKPNQLRQCAPARLRLEQLESRSLLAIVAIAVNLYEDIGGAPGAVIADDTVQPGEKFFAEITAEEFDPRRNGLQRVALNLSWNPNVLAEIDTPFNPSALITPNLPAFPTGTLNNDQGVIHDLGGSSFIAFGIGSLIGDGAPDRFATLHFQALATGASILGFQQGKSSIVTEPATGLSDSQIDFQSPTITVVAPAEPPPVSLLPASSPQTQLAGNSSITPAAPLSPVQTPVPSQAADAAAVSLQTKLFADNGGQSGGLIMDNSISVGDSFFVEIAAQDLRELPQGIGGLSVNVAWNSAVLQEIDQPFNPASTSSQLVTPAFPLFRSGSLDNVAGQITDLGGVSFRSSGSGQSIGAAAPGQFSLLHFRAIAAASASPLSLAVGSSGIGLVGETALGAPIVSITPQSITVVDQRQPPQITVTATLGANPGTIQFTSDLGSGSTASVSTLVRPAFPDAKQFVDIKNTGVSPLTISHIEINAPDVTTDVPPITNAAGDMLLAAGETRRIGLTYAPSAPRADDPTTQSFQVSNGLVIVSDAANTPRIEITLQGASTFDADINYDGRVNIADVVLFDDHVGNHAGNTNFDRSTDPNGDGSIDLGDFGPLNVFYGAARLSTTPTLLAPGSVALQTIAFATHSTIAAPLTVASSATPLVDPANAANAKSAVGSSGEVDAVFASSQAETLLPAVMTIDVSDELAQALTTAGLESINGKALARGSLVVNPN